MASMDFKKKDQKTSNGFCRWLLLGTYGFLIFFSIRGSVQAQVPTPSGLEQVGPYSGQVNLVWTPNPTATVYQVSRALLDMTVTPTPSVVSDIPYSAFSSPAGTPVFTDNQVTDGRSYEYLVAGVDSSGNMGLSAMTTAVPYTIPSAVNPTVSNIHDNSLDLSWSVPLSTFPVSFYNVYRQNPAGGAVSTTLSAATFFTASPTPVATTLSNSYSDQQALSSPNFYAVVAVDNHSVTGVFPSVSTNGALPINSLPPAAPTLVGFIPVEGYGNQGAGTPTATPTYGVDLFWNGPLASEGVTDYEILSNGTAIATITVTATPSPTYSYLDSTVLPSGANAAPVSYSIVALNANGAVTSNSISENIVQPYGVGNVQVTPNATSNSVTVSWSQGVTGTYGYISNYSVYRGLSGVPVPYATVNDTITPAPTATPTPFAVIYQTPSRTPTVIAVDTITNANGYTYWVQPVDQMGIGGAVAVASTPQLDLAPTPVSNVVASSVAGTNNKINVSWSGASPGFYGNIESYNIYRFVLGTPTPVIVATVGATKTSRNDYVDAYSGSVSYSVGAVDGLGNVSDLDAFSNPVALNGGVAPQMPHVIHPIQSAQTLTFNWLLNPDSDQVTDYSVYGSDFSTLTVTPTPIAVFPAPTPDTLTPFVTAVPSPWQSSTYYLIASNAHGDSQPATLSEIAVPLYQVTAVIQTPTPGVNVSWNMTPVPDATPYVDSLVIYRTSATPVPNMFYQSIATVSASTSSYFDTSVTPGTHYSYMVTARSDLNGTPVAESPVSVTGIAYPSVLTWPNAPTGLSASTSSDATTLSWLANPTSDAVQSYTLWHNGTATVTVTPSPTMMAVFVETPGTTSSYQVSANNVGGPSNSSASLSVLAIPSMTPTIALTPPPGYTPTSSPTPMVWISGLTYPNGVSGYNIYRATDADFVTGQLVDTVNAPTSFVSDPGQPGYINYYKVVAFNGSAGVTANFTLSGLVGINLWPNPPNLLINAGSSSVTLTWTAPVTGNSPVTAYDIYRGTASGEETPIATDVQNKSSYVDLQVTPGIPYYYDMDSISSGLNSAPTSEQAVIPGPAPILNGVAQNGQALLTWSPVTVASTSPMTEYVISKLTLPTPAASPVTSTYTTSNLTTTSYNDTSVTFSQGYVYQVAPIAFTTPGVTIYGAYSNPVTLISMVQGPTTVSAVSGDQLVQLRWNYAGVSSNYTYTILRKLGTAANSTYQTIATGLTGIDYTDTGLLDKTLYNYEVVAVEPTPGLTGISQPVDALPAKAPVVDNPVVTLSQTQNGNTLSWTAANSDPGDYNSATMYPLGGYHIYRSSDGGGTYQLLNPQGDPSTSYTDNVSVLNGKSYTYLVRAYDAPPNVNTNDPNMVHESPYNIVTAPALNASTALDRNSIWPYGSPDEQVVHIRFVVTSPGNVQIKVYSLSGTFIKQLVNQYFGVGVYGIGGNYPLDWDGRNSSGDLVASGVYLITTQMNGFQDIEKIAVIK